MVKVSLPLYRKRRFGESHRILNFKNFVALKEDQISPEKAFQEYSKYLLAFLNNEINLYYNKYEHLPFFLEKYHPYYLEKGFELSKQSFSNLSSQFISNFESGKFNDLLLEISYKRLYGKESSDEHPLPESAYTLNEWALEVPVEYPSTPGQQGGDRNDGRKLSRLQLKTPLETSLLVDVPSSVFIFQLVEALKPYYENVPIYFAEHDKVRTAFITLPETEDLAKVASHLNESKIKLDDIVLVFRPCNPIRERLPMGKTGDFLPDLLPESLDLRLRLDVQLLYLRKIHSYCYYGKFKTNNYVDLWDSGGPGYVRIDLTNELFEKEEGLFPQNPRIRFATFQLADSSHQDQQDNQNDQHGGTTTTPEWEEQLKSTCTVSEQQLLWIKDVESFANKLLETELAPPKFELSESVEEKWKQFCNINTLIDAPDKFRCKLCSKLFNDAKFVWKHLRKLHADSYNQVVVECGLPKMKEIFYNAHRDTRSNPFENLVSIPIIHKPNSSFDDATKEFFKSMDLTGREKRPREYYDFDQPKLKKEFVTFAPDEYSRPSVKYDDL
ncbi:uncharacterized protein TOT_010000567 [Theileria orientalis strain Shintoku]|uniref:C2H2-type domain-containing protein n=1 Tax=Theileria orientalis strain Shintoku TaxID=869250 RepID=J4D5P8_THEOR|nr:uncharacterized protein TOT_010000567 [Theileria orientalis strain Shintoku]BAM39105.1 uncharacterized protein TOT_010000567 [Theileria orientalis strain Shintoku]|eukprot:XP_009689406.1 uncharacterized protein TOT_010000567 [Theileria orientalis strain Shintoku]